MSGTEQTHPDHAVAEFSSRCPKLRGDVRFAFQEHGGRPSYVLEDVAKRKYFQVGLPEYHFLRSLDGTRTVRALLGQSARVSGQAALGESQAQSILRWAIDHELLESDNVDQDSRRGQHAVEQEKKQPKQVLQEVLFLKIPLGNPDPFLRVAEKWFGWIAAPWFFFVWLAVILGAGYQMAVHWRAFMESAGGAILPGNWLFLIVTFSLLKLIHELGHGIVAKRFKVPVPEWGVRLLALVSPLTYVDASASWRLSTRWPRICVAAAGMYIELMVAAIAVFVWVETGPGFINTLAYNAIFAASVVTVLFNANPLMRFDGYYILSDMIQIPNLAMKGQRIMGYFGKRYLLGMKDEMLPQAIAERSWVIGTYGFLSSIWKVVIWIGIMSMASSLFKGAGIVIVFAALVGSLVSTIKRLVTFLISSQGRLKPKTAAIRIGVFSLLILLPFILIPVSPSPKMATVVHFPEKSVMRVECPGFVSDVLCESGDAVKKGQLLVKMENPMESAELKELALDIRRSEIQARLWLESGHIASHQSELENLKALRKRYDSMKELVGTLEFRAPIDGIVHGERIDTLPGRFLQPGESVVTVVPEDPPELLMTVAEDDIDSFRRRRNDGIELRLRGHSGTVDAEVERVEARATTALPHLALGAVSGGPLALRQRATLQSERERGLARERYPAVEGSSAGVGSDPEDEALANQELIRPRLLAHARIDDVNDQMAAALKEGEWGYAKLTGGQKYRLGEWVIDKAATWAKHKFDRARNVRSS
ncbi:MAG: HlyD family efflux transporter periplasmic adaptor subunit [Verrucomicrobiae bacterium]|nr:HlyD family efflux transporter periplasmic adaptor subunit [Verrucomicrobiae bacterium]